MIAHTTLNQVSPEAQEHRDAIQAAVDAARREVWGKMKKPHCICCMSEDGRCLSLYGGPLCSGSFSTCPRLKEA